MSFTLIILVCAGLACLQLHDDASPAKTEQECAARLTAMRQAMPERLVQIFGVEPKKLSAAGTCRDGDAPIIGEPRGEFDRAGWR